MSVLNRTIFVTLVQAFAWYQFLFAWAMLSSSLLILNAWSFTIFRLSVQFCWMAMLETWIVSGWQWRPSRKAVSGAVIAILFLTLGTGATRPLIVLDQGIWLMPSFGRFLMITFLLAGVNFVRFKQ